MFEKIDKYAHLPNATLLILQAASAEELERFYVEDTRERYAESFGYSAEKIKSMKVFENGTAILDGHKFSGGASFDEFLKYVKDNK